MLNAVWTIGCLLFVFAWIILLIIAQWKLFKKAGEPGWLSLIPICNTVMMFKIAGMSGWWAAGALLAGFIPVVGIIASIVINVLLAYNLAKAFDKGAGFTVGLVLLAPIFISILAFGKSQYKLK
ncbi:MAG: hypothetical protein IKV94_02465 [Clostridia bacterium]|nr:hypothetical protein [Clostridia bacterium]